jgi:hypothetical protein
MERLLITIRCLILSSASVAFGCGLCHHFSGSSWDHVGGCDVYQAASVFAASCGVMLAVQEAIGQWSEWHTYCVDWDASEAQVKIIRGEDCR